MTWDQFAARHNVSRKTVGVWRQKGLVLLAGNGGIDVAASEARLRSRPRYYRGGIARGPAAPEEPGLLDALMVPPDLGPFE